MKHTALLVFFLVNTCWLLAQSVYTKEVEDQISQFENNLSGRVKIKGKETYNIADRMAFYHAKGLSIAVVHDYKVLWAKGYGWADVKTRKRVTPETLFEPGSISKSLNAVGILKLVQDKRLDLDTDINSYLTSWKFPYDTVAHGKKITLAQLLSHSAGLTVHGFPGYDLTDSIPTVPQILDGVSPANTPPVRSAFEPGIKFQYSGGGTTISQLILTDVTKQPYDEYMYENVLKPMGMVNSFYTQPAPDDRRALCATGYYPNGRQVPHQFHAYPEQAAAGLWMTPTDLCQYIIETQKAYNGESAKVLNQEMTKLRLTPFNDASSALGVFIENRNGTLYFQHSAGNEGFCGQYYGSLESGDGVAVFLNTNSYDILPEVINSIATVYQWKNFYKPLYRETVSVPKKIQQKYAGVYIVNGDRFTCIVKKKDGYYLYADGTYAQMLYTSETDFFNIEFPTEKHIVADASGRITGYERMADGQLLPPAIKVIDPDTLHGSADFFNELGWMLLESKNFEEAIQYLKRGLALHPESLYITGNLAHAYLFHGDYKDALAIYTAHKGAYLSQGFSWEDMIIQDYVYLRQAGLNKKLMTRMFRDLAMDIPEEFLAG